MARPIEVRVTGDVSSATSGLRDVNSELGTLDQSGKRGFGLKQLGTALLAGGALYKAGNYLKEAAFAASDMTETVSKTRQIFGKDAGGILKWSKTTNASLVGTEKAVLDAAGGFSLLLGNKGINGSQGQKWSKNLTNLSADLASFFNTDFEQAAGAVSSALKGEMDPIEAYGVSINDATLKAKAFELGLYSGKGALDQTTKSQAAYALIMEQTAKAQGDVERTQGGFANQWRIMNTELDELKTNVGSALTPIGEAILPEINKVLGEINSESGVKGMNTFFTGIADTIKDDILPDIKDFATKVKDTDAKELKDNFGWIKTAIDQIGTGAEKIWDAFDNLSPNTKANIATLVAAGAALKVLTMTNPVVKIGVNLAGEVVTSAAGAAASATVNALFNRAIPMNVFVVNEGFDIESPAGKSKFARVLNTIPIIGTMVTFMQVGAAESKRFSAEIETNSAFRREYAAALSTYKVDKDRWNAGLENAKGAKSSASAVQAALDLEITARQRGDQKTRAELSLLRENFSSFVGAYYRRTGGGGGAYATSGNYGRTATSALPVVTDEQIARAVYGTLMRSGIRNGQTVASI